MKQFIYVVCLFGMIFLGSCDNEPGGNVPAAELIRSIHAEVSSDNVLRMNIDLSFHKEATCQIEYWKQGEEKTKRSTLPSESAGEVTVTLLLLEPDTSYDFQVTAVSGKAHAVSDVYSFRTGTLPGSITSYTLSMDKLEEEPDGYIMVAKQSSPGFISLINPKGKVVWYEVVTQGVWVANFDAATNTFTAITGNNPEQAYTGDGLLVVDLYGNRLFEKTDPSLYPHHDSRMLPDGDIILVNYVPRVYDLTTRGGSREETVWGDGFTIMDLNGTVKYQWDCFGEIDPREDPGVMENLKDWVHANSVNWDKEGNYYMTFNNTSEMWKIDPQNGDVLYRVGEHGNVSIAPEAWADGLHSPYPFGPDEVLVLDNGRTSGVSRALVYNVNPSARTGEVTCEVKFTKEHSSPYMSNARFINDQLVLFGSGSAMTIAFYDYEGNPVRVIGCNFPLYRAEYIPEIKY